VWRTLLLLRVRLPEVLLECVFVHHQGPRFWLLEQCLGELEGAIEEAIMCLLSLALLLPCGFCFAKGTVPGFQITPELLQALLLSIRGSLHLFPEILLLSSDVLHHALSSGFLRWLPLFWLLYS